MKKTMRVISGLMVFSAIAGAETYDYSVQMKESDGTVQNMGDIRININNEQTTQSAGEENNSNDQLLNQIQQLIQSNYHRYNINIFLSGDTITLKGTVNSDQDKQNIEKEIKKIDGVKNVENNLQVVPLKYTPLE